MKRKTKAGDKLKWPMLVTADEYLKLRRDYYGSRYFPDKGWLEFLNDRNIRLVNCKNVELNLLCVTDVDKIPVEGAGVQFFDILRDIIEGATAEARTKTDEVHAREAEGEG